MVVSTDRPSRTAVTEQPPPRWHTTSRVGVDLGATTHCHGDAVEPVAADAPVLAPASRHGVGRRLLRDRRRGRQCRRPRRAGRREAPRAPRGSLRSAGALCSGASGESRRSPRDHGVVDRARRLDEPLPAVHDAVPDGLGRLEAVTDRDGLALDEVELQARRARVDEKSVRPGPVARPSGSSSPCSRV